MERRAPVVGRDRQIGLVADVLRATGTERTLLVTGAAGAGKTAVLDEAVETVAREGVKVLRPSWETATGAGGAAALADAVYGVLAEVQDGRLPVRLTAVRRAQIRHGADDGHGGELTLLSTLGENLGDAARRVPFALLIDDTDGLPPPTASALQRMLRVFRPAFLPVVMAGRPVPAVPAGAPDLAVPADQVLDLPPLRPGAAGELLAARLGRPSEPALLEAVLRCLGPLAGNPAAVLSVLTALEEDGALLELDGRIGLRAGEDSLRLTAEAETVRLVTAGGPDTAALLARLVHRAELCLEDLYSLTPSGATADADLCRTVDALVRDGVLAADRDGRLTFAVPALAAALRTAPTRGDAPSVHAAVVRAVTGRLGPAAAGASHPRLADHVSAAGTLLPDADAVPLLLAAAGKDARSHHPRAQRAYRSALRRLYPTHPGTPDMLRDAAALGLASGDHVGVLALGEPIHAVLREPAGVDGDADGGGLEFATAAWALSSLHEHRPPYDGAAPGIHASPERMPRAAMLAALGGRYGIGPVQPWFPGPGRLSGYTPLRRVGSQLPTPAELRVLAAAVGSRTDMVGVTPGLPRKAVDAEALGRLREAAAYGDLTGALEAVLGERYSHTGDSTAMRYHDMVRRYLAGDWDHALAVARGIETRGGADGAPGVGQLARALAAEIHSMRGDQVRAREWLNLIPGTVTHPLVTRARLGVRHWADRADVVLLEEALEEAWRDVRRARESGLLMGLERVLLRILRFSGRTTPGETKPDEAVRALEELESLHEEAATALTLEAVLVARGVLQRDAARVLDAYRSTERRGDRPMMLYCSQFLADVGDDPRPWLAQAARLSHQMSIGPVGRGLLGHLAQRDNIPLPRTRSVRVGLSEADAQLIGMVSDGATNRQIAARLACSEKTVEQRLARLFQRTGRRSRVELAAAWLDGSLTALQPGADALPGSPSAPAGG
ncbi:LuxR family transcriptional regulator [Streptomyces sp. NPDC047022]|uniref:helix-turn-helix transcriptional regulator n=1 Tax=Streptomyces sp. NPDC047022 TaxID=3155737 RepID=UPI003411DEC5